MEWANYLGAFLALMILIAGNLVFIFRLMGLSKTEYWTGVAFLLMAFPILYLLYSAKELNRPVIYYLQLCLMLTFLIVEFILDYWFKIEFRSIKWIVVAYVTLFFASTGGMIGIASLAGRTFSIISIFLFFMMTFLAVFQRIKTGM